MGKDKYIRIYRKSLWFGCILHSMESQSPAIPAEKPQFVVDFSFGDHMRAAWNLLKERALMMVILFVFMGIGYMATIVVFGLMAGSGFFFYPEALDIVTSLTQEKLGTLLQVPMGFWQYLGVAAVLWVLLMSYLGAVGTGWIIAALWGDAPRPLGESVKAGFKAAPSIFLVGWLIGLLVIGGYVVLFIPGLIIALLSIFAPYLVVTHGLSAREAFHRSVQLVRSHWKLVLFRNALIFLIGFSFGVVFDVMSEAGSSEELEAIAGILNIVTTMGFSLFSAAYAMVLFRHVTTLEAVSSQKKAPVPYWMYVVGIAGILFLGSTLYFFSKTIYPYLFEAVQSELLPTASSKNKLPVIAYRVPSTCGLMVALPATEDADGRNWIYEERWSNIDVMRNLVPKRQLQENGALLGMISFKTEEERIPISLKDGETFMTNYPGFNVACSANDEKLTLDELYTRTLKMDGVTPLGELPYRYGAVETRGVWMEGINAYGNYYKEALMLGVTANGNNVFYIKIWRSDDVPEVNDEIEAILQELQYIEEAGPAIQNSGAKV